MDTTAAKEDPFALLSDPTLVASVAASIEDSMVPDGDPEAKGQAKRKMAEAILSSAAKFQKPL